MSATASLDVCEPSSKAGRGRPAAHRAIDWAIAALLVLTSLGLGVWQAPQHHMVSPIDEYVYIDYLAKVGTQVVVHRGEETGQYARLYLSCHGVRQLGFYPESFCAHWQPSDVARMPNAGKTTADIYTPLYFGATWLMAQPLRLLGVHDITEAGRLTGWTWLAAGAVLLYLTLVRMRVHRVVAGGLGLLMVGSLAAYWSNTYISTDATALLAGSLMLYALVAIHQRTQRISWFFVVAAALVTFAKLQNLMAVAAAALALVVLAAGAALRSEKGERWRALLRDRRVHTAGLAVVVAVAGQAAWVVIRSMIAVGASPDQGVSTGFGRKALLSELLKFFPGVANGALDPSVVGFAAVVAATLMTWVIVAGVLGLLATARRGSLFEALALSSFVVALIGGPLLAVATIAVSGYYFDLPSRYGMSLIPFFLACAGVLFTRSIWTRYLTPVIGVAGYVAVMALTG